MKCLSHTAESLQKHSELNKKLDEVILENRMQQLYKLAEIDISKMDEKFQAEWHSHNLILIGDLARQYHDFTLMNERNQNVAMILLEVVGDEAEKKKILGFAFHNIGKTYQISKKYSEAFSAYGAAFSVYSKSKDWINESNRKSLMQKLEKDSSYMKYAQREIDIPDHWIGAEGGRLCMNRSEVKIPRNALDDPKHFHVSLSIDNDTVEKEFTSISTIMTCTPPTHFKKPAKFLIPTWCGVDLDTTQIEVQIMYRSDEDVEWCNIEKAKLKNIGNSIAFEANHFSDFMIRLKRLFAKNVEYRMATAIWGSDDGNYVYVAYIDDRVIKNSWKTELKNQGFYPTMACPNPIKVKNGEKIRASISWKREAENEFSPTEQYSFNIDFTNYRIRKKNFVLPLSTRDEEYITIKFDVEKEGTPADTLQWRQHMVRRNGAG
ncbi:uncharacterized protein LOC120329017 isoform X2 [Styela clava]